MKTTHLLGLLLLIIGMISFCSSPEKYGYVIQQQEIDVDGNADDFQLARKLFSPAP
jgi:hypothetical protein